MDKKKIGVFTALLMGIGTIIGTGIFGSMPGEVQLIKSGVLIALVGAFIFVLFKSVSAMYVSSVISANSLKFVSVTKLVNPYVGYANFVGNFNMPVMAAMYGKLFADYFFVLFPKCPLNPLVVSIALILLYTVICWFGVRFASDLNNVFVAILAATIVMLVLAGIPYMDWTAINFREATAAGMSLTALGASINVFQSALNGAADLINISDEIDKPKRTIPLAIILCPCIVAVLYILMATVTLGNLPAGELTSLAQVAESVLSPALVIVFVVGGPIAGIITSLMPVMLMPIANIQMGAKLNILPAWFGKQNKHGVAWIGLLVSAGITIAILLTGFPYGQLMRAFSFIGNLIGLAFILLPLVLQKKYPYTCKNSFIKVPVLLINILSIAGFVYTIYLMYGTLVTITSTIAWTIAVLFILGYVWFFARIAFLKKRGTDLLAELKAPYEPWEAKERELAEASKKV